MRGLVEIKIGGKKRPLKFGTNASVLLGQELGLSYDELQTKFSGNELNNLTLLDMRAFLWSSLVAGHQSKKIPVDFDITDVGDWLDETDAEELQAAFSANAAQLPKGKKARQKKVA